MATNTNRVVITGTFTRDPEVIGNDLGAKFSIAVNEAFKKDEEWQETVSFFDVVAWGKLSNPILRHLTKGSKVTIDGRLKQDRWETDGQKRSKVLIVAQNVEFGAKPSAGTSSGSSDSFDAGPKDEDEDIPF